ncbi:hypothetical protein [Bradyrhizobium sp. USDA 3364]
MFNTSTVFIIGAGAGVEINMPVGSALSSTIADKTHIKYKDFGHDLASGDAAIANALKRITKKRDLDFNKWRAEACAIREGIHHTRSIDAYLNTHKDNEAIRVAGKLAIVQSILGAENQSDVQRYHGHWRNNDRVAQSWFPDLFYIMQDGVGRSSDTRDIFKNVSFISFNYDRCLEHYLFHAIIELYRFDEQTAADVMGSIRMLHPYGQVGSLAWASKGRKVGFGVEDYGDIEGLSQEIKTFNEQIQDRTLVDAIHQAINEAVRIVYLGFHFHKQNLDLMTVTNESGTVRPKVYATTLNRSGPEQTMIAERISKLTGVNRPSKTIDMENVGCKDLFKIYGTTWM